MGEWVHNSCHGWRDPNRPFNLFNPFTHSPIHSFTYLTFHLQASPIPYFNRYVILPLLKSYGDISNRTRSPTVNRTKCLRILPERCARISCWLSSLTRNIVPGSTEEIVPSSSIGCS